MSSQSQDHVCESHDSFIFKKTFQGLTLNPDSFHFSFPFYLMEIQTHEEDLKAFTAVSYLCVMKSPVFLH